jgi:probable HAF family extracellular repeat protein
MHTNPGLKTILVTLATLLTLLALLTPLASAQTPLLKPDQLLTYTTYDFVGADATRLAAINDFGNMAGSYTAAGVTHAFRDKNKQVSVIDPPGSTQAEALGINNLGHVVGSYTDAAGVKHGFLLNGAVYSTLDYPGAIGTSATAVNIFDAVVGQYTVNDAALNAVTTHGFVWKAGVFSPIDFPGAADTMPQYINALGGIYGVFDDQPGAANYHAFQLRGVTYGMYGISGAVGTAFTAWPTMYAILGYFDDTLGQRHGFISRRNGLRSIEFPGASATEPRGANYFATTIVGSYAINGVQHGFVLNK